MIGAKDFHSFITDGGKINFQNFFKSIQNFIELFDHGLLMYQTDPSWFFKIAYNEIIDLRNKVQSLELLNNNQIISDNEDESNVNQHIIMCEMVDIFDEYCNIEVKKINDDDDFEVDKCLWLDDEFKNKYNNFELLLLKYLKEKYNEPNQTNEKTF